MEGQVEPIASAPVESHPHFGVSGGAVHESIVVSMPARTCQHATAKSSAYGRECWAEFGGFEPFVDEFVIGRFLGIEPRQVLEMARAGEVPAHPVGLGHARKRWRFRLSEVEAHFSAIHNRTGAKMPQAVPVTRKRNRLG